MAIMDAVRQCLDKGATILNDKDIDVSRIAAIGISNQRETTILWDRTTGLPLHNAIGIIASFTLCHTISPSLIKRNENYFLRIRHRKLKKEVVYSMAGHAHRNYFGKFIG